MTPLIFRMLFLVLSAYVYDDHCQATITEHSKKLQTGLQVRASQVGADRPLSSGRFSPDDQYFATGALDLDIWRLFCTYFILIR